tara:strand:- start:37105 stop:37746 length:642 start_codon:yes stop_codon:yes gene_type:complete
MLIEVNNISKKFDLPKFKLSSKENSFISVIDNFSMDIDSKDFICLVGNNGSGKTTLLKILADLITQDEGSIGRNGKISFVSTNERSFFWRLSVKENLRFFSSLANNKVSILDDDLINILGIDKFLEKRFMNLSSGQKKRVMIARSLISEADIFLFDEITNSLDESSRKQIIDFIYEDIFLKKNKAIVWATHSPHEINNKYNKLIDLNKENRNV